MAYLPADTRPAVGRHLKRYRKAPTRPNSKTELDVLKERHKFIRNDTEGDLSWEDQLAVKLYDSLFREFAVADLKHYKKGVALRWRTEDEVLNYIGERTCGSLRCEWHTADRKIRESSFGTAVEELPEEGNDPLVPVQITPFQVNFQYQEEGEQKSALVKLVLCDKCAKKLSYKSDKERELRRQQAAQSSERQPDRRSQSPPIKHSTDERARER